MDFTKALEDEIRGYGKSSWTGKIGADEVTLYAGPLTPNDMSFVTRKYPKFTTEPNFSGMVMLIIRKAETADGTKPFTLGKHQPLLERFTNDKIADIFASLFGDQLDPEDEEKFEDRVEKLEANPDMVVCYGLALRLKMDVDDVADWPFDKIRNWLAYFTIADRQRKSK